jgi:hypothetical protein
MLTGIRSGRAPTRAQGESPANLRHRAAVERRLLLGWVKRGERIGITAGLPSGRPGTTSLFQVQEA